MIVVTNLMDSPGTHDLLVGKLATYATEATGAAAGGGGLHRQHGGAVVVDGLVAVNEYGALSDVDCLKFQFVVRVGFAHYPDESRGFLLPLWQQPDNAVVVPLGVPATFPLPYGNLSSSSSAELRRRAFREVNHAVAKRRGTGQRSFLTAFLGRVQNENRRKMWQAVRTSGLMYW